MMRTAIVLDNFKYLKVLNIFGPKIKTDMLLFILEKILAKKIKK